MRSLSVALIALLLLPLATLARDPQTAVFDVQNMTCGLCPITVKKSLQKVPGVTDVVVDLDKKTATVNFNPDKASPDALAKATTDAGFPSTLRK